MISASGAECRRSCDRWRTTSKIEEQKLAADLKKNKRELKEQTKAEKRVLKQENQELNEQDKEAKRKLREERKVAKMQKTV